jgi:hypothetical protein
VIRGTTPKNKTIYYLNREHLCLNLPLSRYGEGDEGYEKLKNDLLFTAEVYSSDLQRIERELIETEFKRGNIHFVTATPALEMGINIGDLKSVLMIGVPPTPANYAQRAGRAGRGKKRDALIVTFCSAASPHDVYAFHNPETVINGYIAPPTFNPANPEILKKHINAFVLRHHLKNRNTLRQFVFDVDRAYCDQIPQMQALFGNSFDYAAYLNEFKQLLERIMQETDGERVSLANYCYSEGIFPDYSFTRDQVIAVDVENRDKINAEQTLDWKDFALTTRDTEQAFRFFVPEQVIYVTGEVYKTLNDGIYEMLEDGARQYKCFFAEKEIRFAQQRKLIRHFDLRQHFTASSSNLVDVQGVLAVGFSECTLSFRNHGVLCSSSQLTIHNAQPVLGYDLKREAVVLRFDSLVCDDILRNSLTAALVREIKQRYGLADGEIRLMLEAKVEGEPNNSRWVYTLLYDHDGNNNLPLRKICQEFDLIIRTAYEKLLSCNCKSDGCYQCIRSYNTQYFDETLSRDRALMFAGYLSGKRRFEPSVATFVSTQSSFDLILTISQQNNEIGETKVWVTSIVAFPRLSRQAFLNRITNIAVLQNPQSKFFLNLETAIFKEDIDEFFLNPNQLLCQIVRKHSGFRSATESQIQAVHERILPNSFRVGDLTKRQREREHLKMITAQQEKWIFDLDRPTSYLLDVAGSGKTNALVSRAIHVIDQAHKQKRNPPNILLTTYNPNL